MTGVVVHPQAIVETSEIGERTRVWAYAHVMAGARVGSDCNIGEQCFIETGAAVGNGCTIKNGTMIWEGVTIEDGVFVGPHVFFTNDLYPRSPRLPEAQNRYHDKKRWLVATVVKRGASLGAGSVILAGVTIGEFAMVAAGAVITKNVAPHALVIGAPARAHGWVCRCGQVLGFQGDAASCDECQRRYRRKENEISIVG